MRTRNAIWLHSVAIEYGRFSGVAAVHAVLSPTHRADLPTQQCTQAYISVLLPTPLALQSIHPQLLIAPFISHQFDPHHAGV